jgi:hypothetical protein
MQQLLSNLDYAGINFILPYSTKDCSSDSAGNLEKSARLWHTAFSIRETTPHTHTHTHTHTHLLAGIQRCWLALKAHHDAPQEMLSYILYGSYISTQAVRTGKLLTWIA